MDGADARIILDVSTSLGFRLSPANKHTRVAAALLKELGTAAGCTVAASGTDAIFYGVPWPDIQKTQPFQASPVRRLMEACVRSFEPRQGNGWEAWKSYDHFLEGARPFAFQAGDLLLLSGASWTYLDLIALGKLKHQHGFKIVGLVYDLLPIHYPSFITVEGRKLYRAFLHDLADVADLIVTPSATVCDQLRAFITTQSKRSSARVVAVSFASAALSSGQGELTSRLRKFHLHKKRFAFCLAPLRKRKHLLWLYSLWAELWKTEQNPPMLVCAGLLAEPDLLAILQADPLWGKAAIFLSNPSDAESQWLYSHSLFCLHPSFEGGMGLPIREALYHGKVCIAADASSLVEAGAGCAIHLPQEPSTWLSVIRKLAGASPDEMQPCDVSTIVPPGPILPQILDQLSTPAVCDQ
jgi:glycosyltransferase involved in cell wall biosynthesis